MPSPIPILRIVTRFNIGGPAIHASLLSTRLDASRFHTCLVIGKPDATEGDLTNLVRGSAARVVVLNSLCRPIRPWHDLVTLLSLVRVAWTHRPRIIHTHMAKAGTLGRLAGLLYNRLGPGRHASRRAILIHTFHGHVLEGYFSPRVSRFFLSIERWLARRTDRLIAVSHTVRRELLSLGIGQPTQWQVIPVGLDLCALSQLPLPNGAPTVRVGMVGRLVPIKNPSLFLGAFRRLAAEESQRPVRAVIVGDGPLRGTLERETKRLGLEGLVHFTGWRRDLTAVYGDLEVTCLTSWNEGTPVALIEAMAAGRAVVAANAGGVQDLLGEEGQPADEIPAGQYRITDRGILVRPGDHDGLVKALTLVTQDDELRRRLGRAARHYVVQRYAHERLVRDITALYERALDTEAVA